MGMNGVSHHVVADDLEGVAALLRWLSFMPPVLGGVPTPLATADPLDRPIAYHPGPGAATKISLWFEVLALNTSA